MKRLLFAIGFFLPFFAVIALNWHVNPFLLFEQKVFAYPGGMKNPMERMEVAYEYERSKAPNVILGTSRIKNIPAYASTYWLPGEVLNMSIASASMYEMEKYFEHIAVSGSTKKVLIGLDYDFFFRSPAPGFDENRLHQVGNDNIFKMNFTKITDTYRSLLSSQAYGLSLSFYTGERPFSLNGTITYIPAFIQKIYLFASFKKATPTASGKMHFDPMASFEKTLTIAKEKKMDVTFIIPPVYAPYMEEKFGKDWEKFETWKRDIVRVAKSIQTKDQQFLIWDFSGYNSITISDDGEKPEWFYDGSHFKPNIGMKILERIYGKCKNNCDIPADFGLLINTKNIESHLKNMRQKRSLYLQKAAVQN